MPPPDSDELRAAIFAYIDQLLASGYPYVSKGQLQSFFYNGERFPLIDPQKGIRKPQRWSTVLSITSTQRPVDQGGYEDSIREDGSVAYRPMRETTTDAPATNRALLHSIEQQSPLLYLIEVATSTYEPVYPVWLTDYDRGAVLVSDIGPEGGEYADVVDLRRYEKVVGKRRLHQEEFRARVLFAYKDRCCICRLRRRSLLDAAHIVDDSDDQGVAAVSNGLAMCRMHHAAYDQYLLGVRPDFKIEITRDILEEVDGPMLRYGLQEIAGQYVSVPRPKPARPDPQRLQWKYERFLDAS